MNKKLKGSGILIVILSSIAFFTYTMSTFNEQEYFGILQDKYQKNVIKEYEKNNDNIDEFYNQVVMIYNNM